LFQWDPNFQVWKNWRKWLKKKKKLEHESACSCHLSP
jgi:hypothetical protein